MLQYHLGIKKQQDNRKQVSTTESTTESKTVSYHSDRKEISNQMHSSEFQKYSQNTLLQSKHRAIAPPCPPPESQATRKTRSSPDFASEGHQSEFQISTLSRTYWHILFATMWEDNSSDWNLIWMDLLLKWKSRVGETTEYRVSTVLLDVRFWTENKPFLGKQWRHLQLYYR